MEGKRDTIQFDTAHWGPLNVDTIRHSYRQRAHLLLNSHWTASVAGSDVRIDDIVPPSASLRTPLKVSIVLSPSLTVTISIPVKLVPVIRVTGTDDPVGVNRQPIDNGVPFSSAVHWKAALSPSMMVAS